MTGAIGLGSAAGSQPLAVLVVLGVLSALPFLLLMLTSFVKVAVVLAILRSAFGAAQVPPGQVVTGLALVLTVFIMAPTGERVWEAVRPIWSEAGEGARAELLSAEGLGVLERAGAAAAEPVRGFLEKHAAGRDRETFLQLRRRLRGGEVDAAEGRELLVLAPAFAVSELRRAFEMGFLIFVPFLVVDLVVASLLTALGFQALTPTLVSLPLKLLLFALADGWNLVLRGLVASYV
ncbi:MAG: EscR/YscR/HrcR family type III secretion system export apparatus protein [Myxococcales bacterium]|nr:EscR/YscR/HrcR family type III secretion system export apparatus protein [Myxococcales bacterium]